MKTLDLIPNREKQVLTARLRVAALSAILVMAAILRFILADYSLWFDEYASLFFAHQPFAKLWSDWMVRETNPPLFYSLLRGWMILIGPMDRVALRVPAIVASLVTIAVVYVGLARQYGIKAAIASGIILSLSAQQIAYAQQLRGYSLFGLAVALSFFGAAALVSGKGQSDRQQSAWTTYIIAAVAANYLHSTGFLWLPISALALMITDRRFVPVIGRYGLQLLAAQGIILLASSWALYIVYVQMQHPNSNISWMVHLNLLNSARLFLSSVFLVRDASFAQKGIIFIFLGTAIWGSFATWKQPATKFAVASWVIAVIVFLLVSAKQPILLERTLQWMAILSVTLIAAGIATIRRLDFYVACLVLISGLLTWNLVTARGHFEVENWDLAIARIAKDPKGVVIVSGAAQGVVAQQACQQALLIPRCPIAIITLAGEPMNAWANGYSVPMPTTLGGKLVLPPEARPYVIQRYGGYALDKLHAAGLFIGVPAASELMIGPLPTHFLRELIRKGCVRKNMVYVPCSDRSIVSAPK